MATTSETSKRRTVQILVTEYCNRASEYTDIKNVVDNHGRVIIERRRNATESAVVDLCLTVKAPLENRRSTSADEGTTEYSLKVFYLQNMD